MFPTNHRPEGTPTPSKDKMKTESKDVPPFQSPLHSPQEGVPVSLDPAHLPDDSDELSSLVDSPSSDATPLSSSEGGHGSGSPGGEFRKMSVYSPSQEQFSIPEDIGTEAQTSSSLPSSAVSDVQGAKQYLNESEYPVSSTSETSTNFYSPSSTSRSYSFPPPSSSITHSPLVSPSPYPGFNPQAFPTGSADGMMAASAMYPNGACMSPSAYMSYGATAAGKQYTWPTTPGGYGAFGMNSHDLMQAGYTTAYPSSAGSYSQMTTMSRSGYPATYFSPQVTPTTHTT